MAAAAGKCVDVAADGTGVKGNELANRVELARGEFGVCRVVIHIADVLLDFLGQFLAADAAIEHRYLLSGSD